MRITDLETLRALYGAPHERAVAKQLDRIDPHARRLIGLSPFVGAGDGRAGRALRRRRHAVMRRASSPSRTRRPCSSRIGRATTASMRCPTSSPIRASACSSSCRASTKPCGSTASPRSATTSDLRERLAVRGKLPATVLRVTVRELYLHCGKAFMRSRLWDSGIAGRPRQPALARRDAARSGRLGDRRDAGRDHRAVRAHAVLRAVGIGGRPSEPRPLHAFSPPGRRWSEGRMRGPGANASASRELNPTPSSAPAGHLLPGGEKG